MESRDTDTIENIQATPQPSDGLGVQEKYKSDVQLLSRSDSEVMEFRRAGLRGNSVWSPG